MKTSESGWRYSGNIEQLLSDSVDGCAEDSVKRTELFFRTPPNNYVQVRMAIVVHGAIFFLGGFLDANEHGNYRLVKLIFDVQPNNYVKVRMDIFENVRPLKVSLFIQPKGYVKVNLTPCEEKTLNKKRTPTSPCLRKKKIKRINL